MNDARKNILRTSLILFLKKSYRDVTMKELVETTGLSKGAFYHYFSSKEALFKEIVALFLSMGAVNYSEFSKVSLKTFYAQYINFLNNSMQAMNKLVSGSDLGTPEFNFFLIMFEAATRFPEFLKMELDMHKKDLQAWESIIATARKNREIKSKSSDEEIANLFLYCTDGVFLRFINNDNPKAFKDYLRNAYDTIYNNLKR
jgi:AcrR family transcriptional regulator